ncbi:group I intron-associated PD-(D/E)XK endonuclease [Nocardioides litoris]|uniref:group I intron-associated PD-(D/E)XK endonuclease n=1 Tax=Nocardioides litoris TaxID=1926648 RepID=UPI001121D3CF|nr:group I intron-associated PD-(D/E)XK endonuclease [Nocardioides litoris]
MADHGRTWTDGDLVAAVAAARSWRGVLRSLGLSATSSAAIRSVRGHADRLGLDTSHFTGQRRWTETQLAEAVAHARSWTAVAERLGLAGGSSAALLRGHALRLGLDVGHLAGRTPAVEPQPPATAAPDLAHLPRAGALLAAAWFTLAGYDVSWPLEPCRYDLVVVRAGVVARVQVKTTRWRRHGSWVVTISSTPGPRRVYDPEDIDWFFVIDGDLRHYLVPVAAVGGMHELTLNAYERYVVPRDPAT